MSKHSELMKEWRQRMKDIVKLYEHGDMSFREIGERYGITSQRVQQIYKRAKQL
jgi:DNA-directed RNA polymerase specialized sigma subunit